MHRLALLCLLAWSATAAAQTIVVPQHFTNEEGLTSLPVPLSVSCRTQQIVNDLVGTPRVVTKLTLRRDAINGVGWGPDPIPVRTLQLDVNAGHGVAVASASTTFAANWVGTPIQVFTGQLSTPVAWTSMVRQAPAPFDLPIVFGRPFLYNGQDTLLVEFVTTTTATGSVALDAGDTSQLLFSRGSLEMHGTGCRTPNGELELRANVQTQGAPITRINYNWPLHGAPALAPALMLVGAQRQVLPVPGLCQPLRLVPLLVLSGTTDASGVWAPSLAVPLSAIYFSVVVETQAAVLDQSQPFALPLAVSNGLASRAAPMTISPIFDATLLYAASPTATVATSKLGGRCLVMQVN